MFSLKDALTACGFNHTQQLDLIRLMEFTSVFSSSNENKENAEREFISNESAALILTESKFTSLEEALAFLDRVDKKWLRNTHNSEGLNAKDQSANRARWDIKENEFFQRTRDKILPLLSNLGLIKQTPQWPTGLAINHVIMHGGLEVQHLCKHFGALEPFQGNLYYVTSPRGAFNDEPSTAEIIAEWINKPQMTDIIRATLLEFKDSSNWTNDLRLVKKAILERTKTESWPSGKGAFYLEPNIYIENGKDKDGRLVKNVQDWPVGSDIAFHLLRKKQTQNSEYRNIKFVPVPTLGKNGKLANTDDNIELWKKLFSEEIIKAANGKKVNLICIANEEQLEFNDQIVKKYLSSDNYSIVTVCNKPGYVSVDAYLDSLARIIFVRREAFLSKNKEADSSLILKGPVNTTNLSVGNVAMDTASEMATPKA